MVFLMSSYFDHFIIIEVIAPVVTNSFIVLSFSFLFYSLQPKLVGGRLQLILKTLLDHWQNLVEENLKNVKYFYIFPMLFFFILLTNLFGFFIYTFAPTTHISITFGLAFAIWNTVMVVGFWTHGLSFLSNFMPTGAPLGLSPLLVAIEMVSNFSRPIALGVRLAANLTAGHILLAILADFSVKLLVLTNTLSILPLFLIIFMSVLEVGVLAIQAYVFVLLSVVYLKDSVILH